MRSYPRVVDEILKENHQVVQVKEVYHLSYRGLTRNNWVSSTNYSLHFLSELFIIRYSSLHFVRYSIFFNGNHKSLRVWLRSVENTEDINASFDGLFVSLFSPCLKKILTTICHELTNIQLSEECHTAAKLSQKSLLSVRLLKKACSRLNFLMFSLRTSLRTFIP